MGDAMFGGVLGLILFVFLLVLGILWFLLPFAVFGVKPLLQRIVQTNQENADAIRKLTAEVWELRSQGQRRASEPT